MLTLKKLHIYENEINALYLQLMNPLYLLSFIVLGRYLNKKTTLLEDG